MRKIVWRAMLAAIVPLAACGGGSGTEPQVEARELSLTPGSAVVFVGDSLQLSATALDAQGEPISGRAATFRSSDTLVATVSAEGVVHGQARGSATIQASIGELSSFSLLNVRVGGIVSPDGGTISVLGGAVTIAVPSGAVTAATEIDVDSAVVQAGEAPPLQGTKFSVGPAGMVLSRPATLSIQYDPTGLSAAEEGSAALYTESGLAWLAVPGSGADLAHHMAGGPITGAGSYAVFAPGPVASLAVSPNSVTVVFGTTQDLLCELRDSAGQVLENRAVRWKSSDTTVARVSQLGKVTPVSLGYTQITASSGGASGISNVTSAFSCNCTGFPSGAGRTASACVCAGAPVTPR